MNLLKAEAESGLDGLVAKPATQPHSILNVSHHNFIAGGSDRIFLEMGQLLSERGHAVIPFCARDERNQPSDYAGYFPESVNTSSPSPSDLSRFVYSGVARASMSRLLTDHPVDLAHLHIYYGKLSASILKPLRERGIPIVQTLHEYKLVCPVYTLTSNDQPCQACDGQHFWRALPRRCNRGSLARTALSVVESYASNWLGAVDAVDHFIGISEFMTAKMVELGIPESKITTIHNFVATENFRASYEGGDYVLYFGRVETVKGIYTLLKAFARLPHVQLIIAGTGSESENVARWIEERGLSNIKLEGFVDPQDLHDLIRGASCSVVPSEWNEPFGLTVIESMALGTPVIATRVGGIPEIISHGQDGLLVEPGDAAVLQEAVSLLVDNSEKAIAMGRAGRQTVEERFSMQRYYDQLMQVYARVL